MACFDEEPDYELEEWIRNGGQCQSCGREKSDAPICDECREKIHTDVEGENHEKLRF